jgi:hypothetical protein
LVVANSLLGPVRTNQPQSVIAQGVGAFYAQGDRLAEALYRLNPDRLRYPDVVELIREHNRSVVQLAILRNELQFAQYISLLDTYNKHMLGVADALYAALM